MIGVPDRSTPAPALGGPVVGTTTMTTALPELDIRPGTAYGFFVDTSVCIGCKACEVACKEWNQLPDDGFAFTGRSYDNTVELSATTWRHVEFVERDVAKPTQVVGFDEPFAWLFHADSCKHCVVSGCLDNCPTGALVRTDFGSVLVQQDVCNGCGTCVVSCPFGVIDRHPVDGRAWKCTMCYDRLQSNMIPACAQTCPTQSIRFGELAQLREFADRRLAELHGKGVSTAQLYGHDALAQPGTQGLHAFSLLLAPPEAYKLPPNPVAPARTVAESWTSMGKALVVMAAGALAAALFGRASG